MYISIYLSIWQHNYPYIQLYICLLSYIPSLSINIHIRLSMHPYAYHQCVIRLLLEAISASVSAVLLSSGVLVGWRNQTAAIRTDVSDLPDSQLRIKLPEH